MCVFFFQPRCGSQQVPNEVIQNRDKNPINVQAVEPEPLMGLVQTVAVYVPENDAIGRIVHVTTTTGRVYKVSITKFLIALLQQRNLTNTVVCPSVRPSVRPSEYPSAVTQELKSQNPISPCII